MDFKNGVLQFPTVDNYINLVESGSDETKKNLINFLDKKKDYMSLRKSHYSFRNTAGSRILSTQEAEIIETNEFLSSLLNSDGLIVIGDYYFKVNLNSEKVFVLPIKDEDQLQDLRQENINSEDILVFSTDDDVLPLLSEGSKGTINGRSQLFCRESNADGDKDESFAYEPFYDDYRQDNKIVYQSVGIYFSLQAKTKMQYKSLVGLWVDAGITNGQELRYYVKYEPKCRNVTENTGIKVDDGPSNELNHRAYESTRGLHKYRYEAQFYGQGYWSRKYIIFDGF